MNKYICIHGHFYQPPRENPWLEAIEIQDSAYPYKDWNERITSECYLPNTASRILDDKGHIIDIVSNYSKMSYNFGPTLLSWMEKNAPKVYRLILESDKESQANFSGHGSAIAQVYNHMIMPLANERDKKTQVVWGIKDFEHRFNRKPEGMWLAEAAVDIESLEVLAQNGIKFTILSPYQAKRIRKVKDTEWTEVEGAKIDPKRSYLCRLPSGKDIVIFFYDGPIAQEIAFGDLLKDGGSFANRLLSSFSNNDTEGQMVNIATDGETYGHHHKFANMALSYSFDYISKHNLAKITIYPEFFEKNPPLYEVEIIENSSWSCSHGVERWRSDCGCCIGGHANWNQKWRVGLRKSMDWLRDELAIIYEKEMKAFTSDPWEVRDDYINVLLDRAHSNVDRFLTTHAGKDVPEENKIKMLRLLEMQRNAMFMYTSCGWFFDDISGIETIQIIQYAARAMQLAKQSSGKDLEEGYLKILATAESNVTKFGNGRDLYNAFVKPSVISLQDVGAHYVISSLFEEYPKNAKIYSYTVDSEVYDKQIAGKQKLVVGKSLIRSEVTWHEEIIYFALLHLGDYNLTVGSQIFTDENKFNEMSKNIKEAFLQSDLAEVIRLIDNHFGDNKYSLWDLFKNDQGNAMNQILEDTVASIESHFRQIYDQYYPLMQSRKNVRIPLPKALAMTVEFVMNRDLIEILESNYLDLGRLQKISEEIKRWSFMRDKESVSLIASNRVNALMENLRQGPQDPLLLGDIEAAIRILESLSLDLDLWQSQNIYFSIGKELRGKMLKKMRKGDKKAQFWLESFDKLGKYLKVNA